MSFCKTNTLISEGDIAIIYLSFNQLYPIKVTKGQSHHTRYGSLKHADLIGKPYGSKFKCSKGVVYVLQGSPEIWTISLPHRTQIIYTPNISVITLQLELKPGSVVIESGTGSASLSHALIRTVYPSGHLHTFEFHQQRAEQARKEFAEHELADYATVYHRDVCNNGFGVENLADAVFLDLPSPWKALQSAKQALKYEGGRICSFSPCIEQVQKVTLELTQLGFTDIYTIESLRRVLCVKKYSMQNFDFNMDIRPRREEEAAAEEGQEANNGNDKNDEEASKRKQETDKKKSKKKKSSDSDNEESESSEDENKQDCLSVFTAKAINLQPGHTGFLTFATLLHKKYLNV